MSQLTFVRRFDTNRGRWIIRMEEASIQILSDYRKENQFDEPPITPLVENPDGPDPMEVFRNIAKIFCLPTGLQDYRIVGVSGSLLFDSKSKAEEGGFF